MAKLEKPSAIEHLDAIVALADAVMVARGDLGVEMPPEEVPPIQKRIVRACRAAGQAGASSRRRCWKSMIAAPTPTRAEASDVATAIYDGADAVMLSAESAAGQVSRRGGRDDGPHHRARRSATRTTGRMIDAARPEPDGHDPGRDLRRHAPGRRACCRSRPSSPTRARARRSLRASRERPAAPILSMTAKHGDGAAPDAGVGRPFRPGAARSATLDEMSAYALRDRA